MKLVFATNNQHKLDEVRKITAGYAEIISLSDIDCHDAPLSLVGLDDQAGASHCETCLRDNPTNPSKRFLATQAATPSRRTRFEMPAPLLLNRQRVAQFSPPARAHRLMNSRVQRLHFF